MHLAQGRQVDRSRRDERPLSRARPLDRIAKQAALYICVF
jgi:hypothetical protein